MSEPGLIARIDALLPQTQCTRCGYPACRPYAEAIAEGEAGINRCPPGGAAGIRALATLLDRAELPLDPDCGEEAPMRLAVIREDECIGCVKCILACPVDAIVGASKRIHTVIADRCTGCELCLPPCPVDCIDLVPAPAHRDATREADASRARYEFRQFRLQRDDAERDERLRAKRDGTPTATREANLVRDS
ncbi:MAG: RnfABCDGE type electron transport complex subunit B [Rhodanobacteraceae bacterium]|nr:RnfABCDGE type electron transport complex subunit B [Rhodanobacteraceae bacterium]